MYPCLTQRSRMSDLNRNIWRSGITLNIKLCLYRVYILPILLHGCETWSTTQSLCGRLDAFDRSLVPSPDPQTVLPPTCYQRGNHEEDRYHSTSYASNSMPDYATLVMSPDRAVQKTTAMQSLLLWRFVPTRNGNVCLVDREPPGWGLWRRPLFHWTLEAWRTAQKWLHSIRMHATGDDGLLINTRECVKQNLYDHLGLVYT